MSFAIIELAGKQWYVKEGQTITVDGILGVVGDKLKLDHVLLFNDAKLDIGTPYVTQPASLTIQSLQAGPKISSTTYKSKSRYRKAKGYRSQQTVLLVESFKPKVSEPKTIVKPSAPKTSSKKSAPRPAAK
jgi:large subunit ribosomal protein L21